MPGVCVQLGFFPSGLEFCWLTSCFVCVLQMFGSFLSHPLRPSDTFYGTGETFLFLLHPRFKVRLLII